MSITKYPQERYEFHDIKTATTGEAIASARFCVKLSSGTIIKTTADTDAAVGLTVEDYASGAQGEYIQKGRCHFIAGGTIAEGDPLCPDNGTAGRVRKAVSGDRVIGTAVTSASAAEFGLGDFDFIANTVV